ncbi:MAG: LysR family transcriptional regulator, partial [Limnobacter sp.]|nr:LysR family transcriptional regulator [Limnobacter sp.]
LTDQGEILLDSAHRVLDASQDLMDALNAKQTALKGALRVCSSTGFGRLRVAPLLARFAAEHPQLTFELELLDRPVDMLAEGYHLDIRLGTDREAGVVYKPLVSNVRVLCAAPKYLRANPEPKALADLQKHRCLLIRERDQNPKVWVLEGPSGTESVSVNACMASNTGEVVKQWMLDGLGIGLRSEWDVADLLKSGRLIRVLPGYVQPAHVVAAYPERLAGSTKVIALVDYITSVLQEPSNNP